MKQQVISISLIIGFAFLYLGFEKPLETEASPIIYEFKDTVKSEIWAHYNKFVEEYSQIEFSIDDFFLFIHTDNEETYLEIEPIGKDASLQQLVKSSNRYFNLGNDKKISVLFIYDFDYSDSHSYQKRFLGGWTVLIDKKQNILDSGIVCY